MCSYLFWEKETRRERDNEGGRGRERGRQNPKQAPPCQCRAWGGAPSHKCEIMTWAETKGWTLNRLSHPDATNFMSFDYWIYLCNGYPNRDTEHFHLPRNSPHDLFQSFSIPNSKEAIVSWLYIFISASVIFHIISIVWGLVHSIVCISTFFILLLRNIPS